jgi:tRNA (cmo5U34)-methyltransferase
MPYSFVLMISETIICELAGSLDYMLPDDKMAHIREDFSKRSGEYDAEIVRIVPYYEEMLAAAVLSLPFLPESDVNVVDLGTGTGMFAWRVRHRFPRCHLLCVDMTEEMLAVARARFGPGQGIEFLHKDFYHLELPPERDAVVSSLALHHLITDDDKKNFYRKVFDCLKEGGVFVNADAVLSSDDWVEDLYMRQWREFMALTKNDAEIEAILERYRREDSLPHLMDQIRWLSEVGFSKVDVVWKRFMGAVVWARR